MRFKTKDDKSAHYFGDFYTLNTKEKRRAVRKKYAEMDKLMKREEARMIKEVRKILTKPSRRYEGKHDIKER